MRIIRTKPVLFALFFSIVFVHAEAQWHAIYLPGSRLRHMKMDGDSSDWDWIPRDRYITKASLNEFLWAPPISPNTLNFRCIVGWNDITNRIYIQAIVYDKTRGPGPVRVTPRWWFGNCFEFMSNPMSNVLPGHSMKYWVIFPTVNKKDEVHLDVGPAWIKESGTDVEFGGKLWKANDGSYVAVYEISLSLWDLWDKRGAAFSKRHVLAAGQEFPFGVWFDSDAYQMVEGLAQWATNAAQNAYMDPFDVSRFVMDAPVDSTVTWLGINRVLKPSGTLRSAFQDSDHPFTR